MGRGRALWVTKHALDRWRQRVDRRGRLGDVKASARRALQVPEHLLVYFGVEGLGLRWDRRRGVLLLMDGPRVVTCYLCPRAHRVLLERHGHFDA